MFQYRQVLVRLRASDTVREIARSGLMGRDKLGELHAVAQSQGWLDAGADVPDDQAIIAALGPARRASSTVSSAEPHRAAVKAWLQAGVQGRAIHAALKREHAYTGSYSAVVRMLRQLRGELPPEVTVRLSFAPGEACLLYTSDAADERSSVDLGGRRILKTKTTTRIIHQSNPHSRLSHDHDTHY